MFEHRGNVEKSTFPTFCVFIIAVFTFNPIICSRMGSTNNSVLNALTVFCILNVTNNFNFQKYVGEIKSNWECKLAWFID